MLNSETKNRGKKAAEKLPEGSIDVTNGAVTVRTTNGQGTPAAIPVKDAAVIVDSATLDKQLHHEPGFFTGWNGAATAGATLVTATQDQYAVSGSVGLVRVVPTVAWLDSRNRTSADFSGSFGKITQPALHERQGSSRRASVTKSSISHFDAERDEYVLAALLRAGANGLRPQLQPGSEPAADLWRRAGLDGGQDSQAGSGSEGNGAV